MKLVIDGTEVEVPGGSSGVSMDEVREAINEAVSGLQPEDVYSTEETRIGTWIDGKPLYRKVFSVVCPAAGAYAIVVPVNLINGIIIKRMDGYLYSNSNPSGGPINFAYARAYIATWNYGGALYMETNNSDYANSPADIILEYTKTTDKAETVSTFSAQDLSLPPDQPPMPVTASADILNKED